jgi:hypothetical protein
LIALPGAAMSTVELFHRVSGKFAIV